MGLVTRELSASKDSFWNAIRIYIRQPNSINKEVLYSDVICKFKIESQLTQTNYQLLCKKMYDCVVVHQNEIRDVVTMIDKELQLKILESNDIIGSMNGNYVMMRKLHPKRVCYSTMDFYEFCIWYTEMNLVHLQSFFNTNQQMSTGEEIIGDYDPYVIVKFDEIQIYYDGSYLTVEYNSSLGEKGINWINSIFVNKLAKIISSKSADLKINNGLSISNQVDVITYYKLYERLKSKYAKGLIENWSENTDPQKFVFEDIGIATYLLLLWNKGEAPDVNSPKQKFFDLGCGNGLLVYILNSEGHEGVGLDIRKRKIWDTYPSNVVLKEETIIPGPGSVYPDADWLIGNHSDELTPWIPVMARRSGVQCQYFVLPCCPFQLNGKVYQRKDSSLSVYNDFIHYVKRISQVCGFETSVDKLRIPSTKRICIIGRKTNLLPAELDSIRENIDSFIAEESGHNNGKRHDLGDGGTQNWLPEFKAREAVETVRNCTRLPKELIKEIIMTIATRLLGIRNAVLVKRGDEIRGWNQGGELALSELADILSQDQLRRLKNECKGLQTLIKNHHYVFRVREGVVRLRSAEEMMAISEKVLKDRSRFKWKEKECWFHVNHPDGCPLDDGVCSYRHG